MTIPKSYTGTLYSGAPLDITCALELPGLVDIPVVVSNRWTTTDNAIIPYTTITDGLTSSNNLQHTATLSFYPLNVTDSRGYQCNLMIVSNDMTGNNFIYPFYVMDSTNIVVGMSMIFHYCTYILFPLSSSSHINSQYINQWQ